MFSTIVFILYDKFEELKIFKIIKIKLLQKKNLKKIVNFLHSLVKMKIRVEPVFEKFVHYR